MPFREKMGWNLQNVVSGWKLHPGVGRGKDFWLIAQKQYGDATYGMKVAKFCAGSAEVGPSAGQRRGDNSTKFQPSSTRSLLEFLN